MVADDGHNTLVDPFCTPSNPFFELDLTYQSVWLFPPAELVGLVLKFVLKQAHSSSSFKCCVLVPDRSSAAWYRHLERFKLIRKLQVGSDLFRLKRGDSFIKLPKVKEGWLVVALNM